MDQHQATEELADFLAGTFHQDMGSPEQALVEFIHESSKECLALTFESVVIFMKSNSTEHEKEAFIKTHTAIYFPAIGLTPKEWLENVAQQIKVALNRK